MRWEERVKGKTEQKTLQPPGAKQQGAMRMLLLGIRRLFSNIRRAHGALYIRHWAILEIHVFLLRDIRLLHRHNRVFELTYKEIKLMLVYQWMFFLLE